MLTSKKIKLFWIGIGIIIILVFGVGIWQYQEYRTNKKVKYCERSSDCRWIDSYGCVNLDFYYNQSESKVPWTILCACNEEKHRCYEVSVP